MSNGLCHWLIAGFRYAAQHPGVRCYVVEPTGAAVLAGCVAARPNHRIQGGGYAMRELPFLEATLVDGYLQVTDEEAVSTARRLAAEEGIFRRLLQWRKRRSRSATSSRRRPRSDGSHPRVRLRAEVFEYGLVVTQLTIGVSTTCQRAASPTYCRPSPLAMKSSGVTTPSTWYSTILSDPGELRDFEMQRIERLPIGLVRPREV